MQTGTGADGSGLFLYTEKQTTQGQISFKNSYKKEQKIIAKRSAEIAIRFYESAKNGKPFIRLFFLV